MKSHHAEGIPLPPHATSPRSRRLVIDPRNGRNRSRRLSILATLLGSAISGVLLSALIFWT